MTKLKTFTGDGAFGRAVAASAQDEVVCGVVLKHGPPVYFLAPADVPPDEVQATSFRIREGRPMGEGEREFVDAMLRYQARTA